MIFEVTKINHIIIIPSKSDNTLFEGFLSILIDDFLWVFELLEHFPENVYDLYAQRMQIFKRKINFPTMSVMIISADKIPIEFCEIENFFNVIWSNKESYDIACKFYENFKYKPIHITSSSDHPEFYQNYNDEMITKHFKTIVNTLADEYKIEKVKEVFSILKKLPYS